MPKADYEVQDSDKDGPKDTRSCVQIACNNPQAYTAWLCAISVLQGFVVNGVTNVNISSLERRFDLSSTQSSFIPIGYDLSAGILVLPITYIGAHSHQPRIIAVSSLLMGVGAIVMTIPHWALGPYQLGTAVSEICRLGDNSTIPCTEESSTLQSYLGLLILGHVMCGVCGAAIYSLGIVFIDSHVSNTKAPLYHGVFFFFAALGPAAGFLIGGQLLNVYVDVDKGISDRVAPDDPRFVGAWWLGYMAAGCLAVPVAAAMLAYPRYMPQKAEAQAKRTNQSHQDGSAELCAREDFGTTLADVPVALRILFCNPVNMLLTCAGVTEGMTTSGFSTFVSKLIQNQFSRTAGEAGMLGGAVITVGAAGGMLLGGLVCRLGKLKVAGMLRMCVGLSVISILLTPTAFISCPDEPLAGVTRHYTQQATGSPLPAAGEHSTVAAPCNAACGCSTLSYEPMCGRDDGLQYFSPCHAGCLTHTTDANQQLYLNCSCITSNTSDGVPVVFGDTLEAVAVPGRCPVASCDMLYVFLVLFLFIAMSTYMIGVPAMHVTMRCIPESQSSFSLGVKWAFIRCIGMTIGPVAFGAIFDNACLLWQQNCDTLGSCWIYDKYSLSLGIFLIVIALKIASLIFFSIACAVYKPPINDDMNGKNVNGGQKVTES